MLERDAGLIRWLSGLPIIMLYQYFTQSLLIKHMHETRLHAADDRIQDEKELAEHNRIKGCRKMI